MTTTKKLLLGVVAVLVLTILGILIFRKPAVTKVHTFPETMQVYNYTEHYEMDTLAKIILYNGLGIDTINLYIYNEVVDFSTGDISIQGYIMRNHFQEHTYNIFVKKKLNVSSLDFLAHELVHLQQMENGDLIEIFGDSEFTIYRGDSIELKNTPYILRPYEIEAISRSYEIKKLIRKIS